MSADRLHARLVAAGLGEQVRRDVPLSSLGFWRLGGPAALLLTAETDAHLQAAAALGVPLIVLGNGSNLLIADAGVSHDSGVVVRLQGDFRQSHFDLQAAVVEAGGGLLNTVLLSRAQRAGVGGLGCLAGIPGTLGGAVRMNAGWRLGELSDILLSVDALLPTGEHVQLSAEDLGFRYRHADGLPEGALVTRVRLRLRVDPAAVAEEAEAVRLWLGRRKESQPLDRPSCGSVFQNPPGDHAGRLIEAVGLKGHALGGACISERHANFIVNTGAATAAEVYDLIALARRRVWQEQGVVLAPEVRILGDWPASHPWPPPL